MSEKHTAHHITPLSTYYKVFAALIGLTVITVAISLVDLGILNTPVALLIATVKVYLVMTYFMHMKYEGILNRITIGSAFIFVLVFFSLTAMDVFTRVNYKEIGLEQKAKNAEQEQLEQPKVEEHKK